MTGPVTAALVEATLAAKRHTEQGYRACLGILRLAGEYPVERMEGKRTSNPRSVQREADQRAGVRRAAWLSVRLPSPGRTWARYSFTGSAKRRQDSTTERMAATLGPDLTLPTCSQFLRPIATGRIEFSAKLFDNSISPHSKQRASFGHWFKV